MRDFSVVFINDRIALCKQRHIRYVTLKQAAGTARMPPMPPCFGFMSARIHETWEGN